MDTVKITNEKELKNSVDGKMDVETEFAGLRYL
jgi:hypothetical protein